MTPGWRPPYVRFYFDAPLIASDMNQAHKIPAEYHVERLLSALAGVVSARIILEDGRISEIHVLASPSHHPKQIVRNVESALSAGLGIVVDRRLISVAQLRADAIEIPDSEAAVPSNYGAGLVKAAPPPARLELLGFKTSASGPFDASCTVTFRCGEAELSGTATGANTPVGRAESAARAVLSAIASFEGGLGRIGLEGASLVDANGRQFVLVSAHALEGRNPVLLTGVAPLGRSPEEAGILACLHATNRSIEHALL